MSASLPGIHHVTAITGDGQRNVDFYAGTLGLRFVKRTVNFDMPNTYHLYYGDEVGSPGTAMTFFVWPHLPHGPGGPGQVTTTAFSIPPGSAGWWLQRLAGEWGARDATRFGARAITLHDPDGIALELVESGGDDRPWTGSGVPAGHAIRGFHGVTLSLHDPGPSAALLMAVLGFVPRGADDGRIRFAAGDGGPASTVDLLTDPGAKGAEAAGTVHHVAFRTRDDERQLAWRQELVGRGLTVTPVMDRCYFHSIYFREPGGVLFEIATDGPGFTVDEPVASLGTSLRLPPWLEPRRTELESALAPLTVP